MKNLPHHALHATAIVLSTIAGLAALPPAVFAQSSVVTVPSRQVQVHVRGTLQSADAQHLIVQVHSGEIVRLARAPDLRISEVYPIRMSDIKQGSFVGTSATARDDGTLEALEVHVFPESAQGTGEGHYSWDLQQQATMTNATVSSLAPAPASIEGGRQLRLSYPGGEKTVIVPANVPVATWQAGDAKLLVAGAKVFVITQEIDGQPTALSVLVGRDGYTPPM